MSLFFRLNRQNANWKMHSHEQLVRKQQKWLNFCTLSVSFFVCLIAVVFASQLSLYSTWIWLQLFLYTYMIWWWFSCIVVVYNVYKVVSSLFFFRYLSCIHRYWQLWVGSRQAHQSPSRTLRLLGTCCLPCHASPKAGNSATWRHTWSSQDQTPCALFQKCRHWRHSRQPDAGKSRQRGTHWPGVSSKGKCHHTFVFHKVAIHGKKYPQKIKTKKAIYCF